MLSVRFDATLFAATWDVKPIIDFLTKPVRDQVLLDAIIIGIERDIAQRAAMQIVNRHASHFNTVTRRERQSVAGGGIWARQHADGLRSAEVVDRGFFFSRFACLRRRDWRKA